MKKFLLSIIYTLFIFSIAYSAEIDTPEDFNNFLKSCTPTERIQMMYALHDLPSRYNTASLEIVLKDFDDGKLDENEISPEKIRKTLVWRAYNKMTYIFRNDKEVDYHGILQWAAGKLGLDSEKIKNYSTFDLEKEVAKKYFDNLWERLSPEQREELLNNFIKDKNLNTKNQTDNSVCLPISYSSNVIQQFSFSGLSKIIYLSWNEVDIVSAFIMTVNIIKEHKLSNGK